MPCSFDETTAVSAAGNITGAQRHAAGCSLQAWQMAASRATEQADVKTGILPQPCCSKAPEGASPAEQQDRSELLATYKRSPYTCFVHGLTWR